MGYHIPSGAVPLLARAGVLTQTVHTLGCAYVQLRLYAKPLPLLPPRSLTTPLFHVITKEEIH